MIVYVVTFLYPKAIPFLSDLIESLKSQDYSNFELIIFNDGVYKPEQYFQDVDFSINVVDINAKNILEVRIKAFEYLRLLPECRVIFQDADDRLSGNRISRSIALLNHYSIICNDLSVFHNSEKPSEGLWKDRLGKGFEFNHQFLLNQNILGFGNTSIVSSILNYGFKTSDLEVIPDWYLFYQLMYNSEKVALFTSSCQTHYRMHDSNWIGVKGRAMHKMDLSKILRIKESHYHALREIGIDTDDAMRILEVQKRNLNNYLTKKIDSPFWWEQTDLLNE